MTTISKKPANFKNLQDNALELNEIMISELRSNEDVFESRLDNLLYYLKTTMHKEPNGT